MVGVRGSIPRAPTTTLSARRRGPDGTLNMPSRSPCPTAASEPSTAPVTVAQVAADIGPGLAKAALAGRVDGKLVDTLVRRSSATRRSRIVTGKDPEGLEIIRHSTAHLLAQAVQAIYPDAQVTIGPVIEDGFYYDFAFSRPFTPEDLAQIRGEDARAREGRPQGRAPRDAAR